MKLAYNLKDRRDVKAVLGLIVLQADETMEDEFRSVLNEDNVRLYHSRIPSGVDVTPQTLMQMKADLPAAAALLPASAEFDVIGYGCTSGATFIGPQTVCDLVQASHPGAAVTDPISAVVAACRKLKIKRMGFITPYAADVSEAMRKHLEKEGLKIADFASFEQKEEAVVARISDRSVLQALVAMGADKTLDGLFVSCTNLRSFSIIDEAERLTGKPVITSNQALYWHMLTLAGLPVVGTGPGRLFSASSQHDMV